jgi:hypothetical protein
MGMKLETLKVLFDMGHLHLGIWFSGPGPERLLPSLVSRWKGLSTSLERDLRNPERPSTAFLAIFGDSVTRSRTTCATIGSTSSQYCVSPSAGAVARGRQARKMVLFAAALS